MTGFQAFLRHGGRLGHPITRGDPVRRRAHHRRRPRVHHQGDGWFRAYDAKTGKVLWSYFAGAGVNAPPASYSVDGKQYIVVGAGGNVQIDFKRGNNIIAFTVD